MDHIMPLIDTSTRTLHDEFLVEIVTEVFIGTIAGRRIAQELSYKDLKNMTTIKVMAQAANFELNRRFRVLHYRDGEINPPFLRKSWEIASQTNLIDDEIKWEFEEYHWLPSCAILFGHQQPLNIMGVGDYCYVVTITSQKKYLEIFCAVENINECERVSIDLDKIKRDPMNGMFFPYAWHWNDNLYFSDMRAFIFKYEKNIEFTRRVKNEAKLIILIVCNGEYTHPEHREFKIAQIREKQYKMPICVVAQSSVEKKERFDQDYWNSKIWTDNLVMTFRGFNMEASTFVVDTEDDETLKKQFLDWKENLNFLDSHQIIAFHFTIDNSNEPENGEQIFSDIFQNIPLSTLRLHGGPSITGVSYQAEMEFRFDAGPVYAIVGLRMFGCDGKDSCEESG
uniref:Uncharacterized protein n=1 Tax=Onchocerca volvulus TaxID=6282 RepID=A0A8R1XR31_ONCVO